MTSPPAQRVRPFATKSYPTPQDHQRAGQGLIKDLLSSGFEMEKDVNMSASNSRKCTLKPHPTKEEIALLPAFEGLQLNQIVILESPEQFKDALALIQAAGVVGFDTESKPVFIKGGKNDGPDVVQIALDDRAYVVPIGTNPPIEFLKAVLGSKNIIKVGFGGPLCLTLASKLRRLFSLAEDLIFCGFAYRTDH